MTLTTQKTIRYTDDKYRQLMGQFNQIASFAAIGQWDHEATAEVERIEQVINQLDGEITQSTQTVKREQDAHAALPFWRRWFHNQKELLDAQQHVNKCQSLRKQLDELAAKLQDTIDFTPNSADDKKQLLVELRQRKKALQLEKREVASEMKAIRVEARQKSANIGPSYGSRWVGAANASSRREIRLEKENALRPNETRKAAIERQLLAIDRRLAWLENIK